MTDTAIWIIFAYLLGSMVTYFLVLQTISTDLISKTIDQLIDSGFLRTIKKEDGEIEIIKWNQDTNE